ncbi:MAG: 50S ribosomal protein L25 [Thermoguttaceae bacterium]
MEVETLTVELRESLGKRRNRRLREGGKIPAVIYGHKAANISLVLQAEEVYAAVRRGSRFVQLKGSINEKAIIKECQWDVWGQEIKHIDFARVSEHEKVNVNVAIELRGEAPGTKEGGVVKHVLHQVDLECEAAYVPEAVVVNINNLGFNQSICVSDLELPQGAKALIDPATVVVSCNAAVEVSEESEAAGENEPEVIGRKKSEEEGE